MRRRLAALALLALAAGCSPEAADPGGAADPSPSAPADPAVPDDQTSASPTTAPEPPPPATRGSCHRMSYAAALAPSTHARSVPCAQDHTSETYLVGRLDTLVRGRLLAVDSRRVQRQVADTCPGRLDGYVGGTEEQRRLSMVRAVWFTPTVRASDAGADWLRCDVVVATGDQSLLRTTGSLRGALDTESGRDRYGLCGTAEPGTPGFRRVVCARPHAWRAVRTVALAGDAYPGEAAARSAGEQPCRDAGRAAADDPLDFQWGYEWPTRDQWRAGQTWGVCWVPAAAPGA